MAESSPESPPPREGSPPRRGEAEPQRCSSDAALGFELKRYLGFLRSAEIKRSLRTALRARATDVADLIDSSKGWRLEKPEPTDGSRAWPLADNAVEAGGRAGARRDLSPRQEK
ncbi:unnamed protein product, partial [Polarella glacialis]